VIPIYQGEAASEKLTLLTQRNWMGDKPLTSTVETILQSVRTDKDTALKTLAQQFGDEVPDSFLLRPDEIEKVIDEVSDEIKEVMNEAAENIRAYAQAVMNPLQSFELHRHGYVVGMDFKPVERVACYVPGGRYPLPSTALMTAITAQVAGVPEICIFSPNIKHEVIYAGTLAGVKRFYNLGGAQAVAAAAFGTESIDAVDMIVGPGNAYVTEAKRQLQGIVGIDMLAGPSEVAIIADAGANPEWTALDMLSQAEHDVDAQAYLFTDSLDFAQAVQKIIGQQVINDSVILVFETLEDCIAASNQLAPEHLELHVKDPVSIKPKLKHYGALFMGYEASVPFGDYMAGPNHTLPTAQTARFSGGLSPLTFLRPQSWLSVREGLLYLAEHTEKFAQAEGLTLHAQAAHSRKT